MTAHAASQQPEWEHSTSTNLLKRVVDGDQQAWRRFVELYSALIYAKCRSRNLSPEDSADVVQDVFRKVHAKLSEFRKDKPEHGFRRWLRTVARNAIIDHLRKQAVRPQPVSADTMETWLGEVADCFDPEADAAADKTSARLMLHQALSAIRQDYHENTWQAFWWTVVDGHTSSEVAADLDMSPGNVRQAKYKILKRLREELEDLL